MSERNFDFIQDGNYYLRRDGEIVGPAKRITGSHPYQVGDYSYYLWGNYLSVISHEHPADLVRDLGSKDPFDVYTAWMEEKNKYFMEHK